MAILGVVQLRDSLADHPEGLRPLFVILLLSLHLFMTEGTPIFRIWFIEVTWEGLFRGVMMGVRLALLVMGTSLLTLTTSPINLTDGIESLLKPESVSCSRMNWL